MSMPHLRITRALLNLAIRQQAAGSFSYPG
ncbi:hypothetical protein P3T25_009329 [Paraburkholderia sp. GAS32]